MNICTVTSSMSPHQVGRCCESSPNLQVRSGLVVKPGKRVNPKIQSINMRLLYISADPGIDVDNTTGGGSHIHETLRHLKQMGHTVFLVAPGTASVTEGETSHTLRVVKHRWFQRLLKLNSAMKSGSWESYFPKEDRGAEACSGNQVRDICHLSGGSGDVTGLKSGNKKKGDGFEQVTVRETVAVSTTRIAPVPSERQTLKSRLVAFFYGAFRHRLNRLEEQTQYKKRFLNAVETCIREYHPQGVYERYALGHHGVHRLCLKHKIPHILEVNALLAREAHRQHRLHPWSARRIIGQELNFLSQVGTIFVVSEQLKMDIGPGHPNIIVNPNGVDTRLFDPQRPLENIKKKHGIEDRQVVGWIGSFGPERGVTSLLNIAVGVLKKMPTVCFMIVGDGPLRPWVETEISRRGMAENILLTGGVSREQVPHYIAAMDIALAPYPPGGAAYFSPLKVFEYMAMARPVVATDRGQCVELLKDGAGVVLPPGAPELWAATLEELLSNPQKRLSLGNNARQRVLAHYTWNDNVRRIVEQFTCLGEKI